LDGAGRRVLALGITHVGVVRRCGRREAGASYGAYSSVCVFMAVSPPVVME
jgi:hypothetical protein